MFTQVVGKFSQTDFGYEETFAERALGY